MKMIVAAVIAALASVVTAAQSPASLICQFEKIATAGVNDKGVIETTSETSEGDLVLASLNTENPTVAGNLGTLKANVIRRTKDAIWLVVFPPDTLLPQAPVEMLTVFFDVGIVMHTKTELLMLKPFGLVEIGRCKAMK